MEKVTNFTKNVIQDLAVNAATNIAMDKLLGVKVKQSIIHPIKT